MADGYILDSNHLGATRPGSLIRKRVLELPKKGTRIGTCVPVLCEVEVGIQQVSHPEEYRRALRQLLRRVRIWPIDLETAKIYGEIYQDLRRRGRVLSQVDMMMAALARQMSLTILTTDRDFEALSDIPVEDWSSP